MRAITVAAVESGESCLEESARHPADLVLLDIWLDGIDGLETLARIQEIAFESRPVAVMISGHGKIETAVKATKLGAFDFLEKPLSIQNHHAGARTPCNTGSSNWKTAR